jgi:gentisate 1,2-dioxygenase
MDRHNTAPLWEVLHALIPNEPATRCKPYLWKYKDVRPYITEAGKLITAKEAIRRVLVLENPGMRGESCITQSLYAGMQLVMPGETAPTHRHSASALRFVIESQGGYTAVDGERTTMQPGDFVVQSWYRQMTLMRRCFLSVAKSVKYWRMSRTTSGRSIFSTVALTCRSSPSP